MVWLSVSACRFLLWTKARKVRFKEPMVRKMAYKSILGPIFRFRFQFMLVTLFFYIVLVPFIQDYVRIRNLLDIFFIFILISSIYAVGEKKGNAITAVVLVAVLAFFDWVGPVIQVPNTDIAGTVLGICFFGFVIFSILSFIFHQDIVTQEVISASVSVYLLMGIAWAMIYNLLERIYPGSFLYSDAQAANEKMIFSYYSFVTLTTLGYGDISPVTSKAATLSVAEAIIGQLYLTVLIARLVGLHISHSTRQNGKKE